MRIATVFAVALLTTASLAGAEHAQAAIQHYQLNIPRQSLDTALRDLAQQTGLQIGRFSARIDGSAMVGPVLGDQTPAQALKTLLNNTGLDYKIVSDTTIAVYNPKDATSAQFNSTVQGIEEGAGGEVSSSSASGNQEVGKNTSESFRVAQVDQGQGSSASSVGPQTSSPQANSNGSSTGLSEIVVTAQKRTELAQNVPVSLQVLSGEQLQDEGVTQLSDYIKEVPGLTFAGASDAGHGMPVLRGVSSGLGAAPLVGIYLDGVPITPSSPNSDGNATNVAFDPDLGDIERVEVLEGPQSTLYGASSMGGVINFVTKQPDFTQFSGSVRVAGTQVDGGGAGYLVRSSVNVPIVSGSVALRASVFYRDDPGFVDNDFNHEKDVNRDSVKGARLSLAVKFSDRLETTLSGLVQNIDSFGPNLVYLNPETLRPSLGNNAFSSLFNQPTSVFDSSLSDTTTLDFGVGTLTNVASYADSVTHAAYDVSSASPGAGVPVVAPEKYRSKRLSDELRVASQPGRLEWLLGAFYTHEIDPDFVGWRGTDLNGVILSPSSPNYNLLTYINESGYLEKAVFGDLTWHVTDQWTGAVGVRYSANRQSYLYDASGVYEGGVASTNGGTSSDSANSYLATLTYKPTSDTSIYLRTASAYRPGGPNILGAVLPPGIPQTFGADKLWNYELGIKGSSEDQRVSYSADIFHMRWTDIQLEVAIPPSGAIVVENASSAKSDGVEASVQVIPVDRLTLTLRGAYTDAKLTSSIAAPTDAVSGDPLPYSAKEAATAVLNYTWNDLRGAVPHAGLTYAYHGSEHTQFTTNATTSSIKLPSYETLDLRGGFDWPRYSVLAGIENVANKYGLTDAQPASGVGSPLGGIIIKPRTFGISLTARF